MSAEFAGEHQTPPDDSSDVQDVEQTHNDDDGTHWEHEQQVDATETTDSSSPEPQRKPSLWQSIFRQLWPDVPSDELTSRLEELDSAIAQHPEAGVNYVLRGELFLKTRHYESAYADFQHALEIVSNEVENNNWGIVAQALQDRAQRGIQQAGRHLVRQTTNNSGGEA